jgi:hypothetical protein
VVGAAFGLINLPQLYSHTGNDLLGGLSELMTTCVDRSFNDSLVFLPFFRSGKINFSVCRWHSLLSTTILAARVRWLFYNEDVCPEVVDMPFLSDFVDGTLLVTSTY